MERYGIGPELMVDFRGMVGDPSDNLPGVPGVGEKGASQLLQKYGSLDEILDHAGEQTPKRREALTEHAANARKTRDLALIRTDAPVEIELEDVPPLEFGPERMEALRTVFERFEFGSLLRRLEELSGEAPPPAAAAAHTARAVPVDATPDDLGMRLAGIDHAALALGEEGWAVAVEGDEVAQGPVGEGTGAALERALSSPRGRLPRRQGRGARDRRGPAAGARHDDRRLPPRPAPARRLPARRRSPRPPASGVEGEVPGHVRDAVLVRELATRQRAAIDAAGLGALYDEVELPVTRVLAAMEEAGVRLDVHRLGEIAARVRDAADELRDQIWELAGRRVRHRLAQAARPGALRAARAADLPQGQDRLEHRPQGAEAARGQAPDRQAGGPVPRA